MPLYSIRKINGGLLIDVAGIKFGIDKIPRNVKVDYNLISHAHVDHLPHSPRAPVFASIETLEIAKHRGYRYHSVVDEVDNVEVYNAGHILGSWSFLLDGSILYTGDINPFDRGFLRGFRPPQADILIIEATYGEPTYRFGDFKSQINRFIRFVSDAFSRGYNLIVRTHPLGKPQILTFILRKMKNLYCSSRVTRYNKLYSELINLDSLDKPLFRGGRLEEPFIVLAANGEDIPLPKEYNVVDIRISGFMAKVNKGVAVSDHPDFDSLLEIIDRVSPKKVYTVFGYSRKLAEYLNMNGYDAASLDSI